MNDTTLSRLSSKERFVTDSKPTPARSEVVGASLELHRRVGLDGSRARCHKPAGLQKEGQPHMVINPASRSITDSGRYGTLRDPSAGLADCAVWPLHTLLALYLAPVLVVVALIGGVGIGLAAVRRFVDRWEQPFFGQSRSAKW
jgi:hypothetical protein